MAYKSSKPLFDHSKKLYKNLTKYLSDEIFVIGIAVDDEYFVSTVRERIPARIATNSDGMSMELEELNPGALIGPQQDVESIERWAERNGISYGTARAWVYRGVLPSVKLGKLRMVNSALLRTWLLEQEWSA